VDVLEDFYMNRLSFLRLLGAGVASAVVSGVTAGAALAQSKPIPGVGVRICKRPGGSTKRYKNTTTGADGSFRFNGLAAGSYDVIIGNGAPQIFVVGPNGVLAGKAMQDGTKPAFVVQDSAAN
jgi:Carboxypeptidase regulatory-like domain